MNEIEKYILGAVGLVISFFFKDLHIRFKNVSDKNDSTHEKLVLLKADVKALEERQTAGVDQIKEVFNIKFDTLTKKLEEMQSLVVHTDNTMKTNGQLFKILTDELKKK